MKIINQNGYSKEELRSWRVIVYRNLIESAQTLVQAMTNLNVAFKNSSNNVIILPTKKMTNRSILLKKKINRSTQML